MTKRNNFPYINGLLLNVCCHNTAILKLFIKSWRWVAGVIFFLLIITCLPLVFNWTFLTDNAFVNLAIVYQKYLLIAVILAPAFHQVYLNWLFSSIYKGYLKNKVREEYNKYNSSLKGIETKNRSLVDPIYLNK